ncbi:uncharacterized protein VTP21DRAFT_3233 [Calcarisporiella thermophila]|uniref:uncharacterized protein n=1 Tax=Calcarisporiella thermophila TaxID=911321 RepID=UPI0037429547
MCPTIKPGPLNCSAPYCKEFPSLTVVDSFVASVADIEGFIGVDNERRAIVVAIRASSAMINWLPQALAVLVPYNHPSAPGARVHYGIYQVAKPMFQRVTPMVREQLLQHPGYEVEVVGWSLGGWLTVLQTLNLLETVKELDRNKLVAVTVGEPHLGNAKFVEYYDSYNILTKRLVSNYDLAPHTPPAFLGFKARKYEIFSKSLEYKGPVIQCIQPYDPVCSGYYPVTKYYVLQHFVWHGISLSQCIPEFVMKGDVMGAYNSMFYGMGFKPGKNRTIAL